MVCKVVWILAVFTWASSVKSRPVGNEDAGSCSFRTESQSTEGDKIVGKYTYLDPLGSHVEVEYSVNLDGSNYSEHRRITKNGGKATSRKIVDKIVRSISPTLRDRVEQTLDTVDNLASFDRASLVQAITSDLRAVIFLEVQKTIGESGSNDLAVDDNLTNQIVDQLRPIIMEAVGNRLAGRRVQFNSTRFEEETVDGVVEKLKPTLRQLIRTVLTSSGPSSNIRKAIVDELAGKVRVEVERAVSTTNTPEGVDVDAIAGAIMAELRPIVLRTLDSEIEALRSTSVDKIVEDVVGDLEPHVVATVREVVSRNEGADLGRLRDEILVRLRPAVLAVIREVLRSQPALGNVSEGEIVDKIVAGLRPFVNVALRREVEKLSAIVDTILARLRPVVVSTIDAEVDNADEADLDNLAAAVLAKMEAVVSEAVDEAEQKLSGLDVSREKLVGELVGRIRPFVVDSLAKKVSARREDAIVDQVKSDIDSSLIVTEIREFIGATSTSELDNTGDIVDQVVGRLRTKIRAAVVSALAAKSSSSFQVDVDAVTERIVSELSTFIVAEVKKQVAISKTEDKNLVDEIIKRLRPAVVDTIASVDLDRVDEQLEADIVADIPERLRKKIQQRVRAEYVDLSVSEDQLVDSIWNEMWSEAGAIIESEDRYRVVVGKVQFESIMKRIMSAVRTIIVDTVAHFRESLKPEVALDGVGTIFGVSGQSSVSVDTPLYQYKYNYN